MSRQSQISVNSTVKPTQIDIVNEDLPRNGKPGVLVVDDDRLLRLLVQLALERDGFEVCLAPSGREAIELYRQQYESIAVVLLDVRMPDLDGPATLDGLRIINPDVLACFMSGDTGDYEPAELLRRGAAHVFAKPFHLPHLANFLWQLVGA